MYFVKLQISTKKALGIIHQSKCCNQEKYCKGVDQSYEVAVECLLQFESFLIFILINTE